MATGSAPPTGFPFPLGRVRPAPDAWAAIRPAMARAPRPWTGPPPTRSAELWRYRHPRLHRQWIGDCVGQGFVDAAELRWRLGQPSDTTVPPPATSPAFSPLAAYQAARRYSAAHGRPLDGEGAIVSDAAAALAATGGGFVPLEAWPDTASTENAYDDRSTPSAVATAVRTRVLTAAILEDPDEILTHLAAGNPVVIGTPWRGGQATGPNGFFEWSGGSMGGHCTVLTGYDLSANGGRGLVWIDNSWPGWGAGNGVGLTTWCDTRRRTGLYYDLTADDLASGESEAVVLLELDRPPVPLPNPNPTPTPAPGSFAVLTTASGRRVRVTVEDVP